MRFGPDPRMSTFLRASGRTRLHLAADASLVLRRVRSARTIAAERARKPRRSILQGPQRLLQRLGEGAADRHHLAHRLHAGGEGPIGVRELLEVEARDLD